MVSEKYPEGMMQANFSTLLAQAGYSVPEAARALGYSEGHIYR